MASPRPRAFFLRFEEPSPSRSYVPEARRVWRNENIERVEYGTRKAAEDREVRGEMPVLAEIGKRSIEVR